jgi:hypothetical protein
MRFGSRRLVYGIFLLGCLYAAPVAHAQSIAPAPSGSAVTGFRDAVFGMSQDQVLAAIDNEFKIQAGAVKHSLNSLQRTEALTISVPNLIPNGGTATVSYIFGYQTHKLIEVNLLWSQATDAKMTASMLYQNGASLQQYFASAGFVPSRSSGNIALQDGILLFRTTDADGNAVLLVLSGTLTKDTKTDKATLSPTALTLAYAVDPAHADIFNLPKGSF